MRQKAWLYQNFKFGLICSLGLCLWGCKTVPASPSTNPLFAFFNRSMGILVPEQEIEFYEVPSTLEFQLDSGGNGFLSSSSSRNQTKAFVFQNYRYQSEKKALNLSGLSPIVFWQSTGIGEIFLTHTRPFSPIILPKTEPLTWTRARVKDFQLESSTITQDKTQSGQQFWASAQLDSQGNGAISGILNPSVSPKDSNHYPLAYVPIQDYQVQNNIIKLAEPILSKQTPMAWFNTQQGLLLFQTEQGIWKLKAIEQEKIQTQAIDLGPSLTPPLSRVDHQGNGFIALQTLAYQWSLHRIKQYHWINSQELAVKHRFDRMHQIEIVADKGIILSYNRLNSTSTPADLELELSYFEVPQKQEYQAESAKNLSVKSSQFLRFPLNGRFPHGLAMHITPQGQGILAIGSSAKFASEGKLHLFPFKDFRL